MAALAVVGFGNSNQGVGKTTGPAVKPGDGRAVTYPIRFHHGQGQAAPRRSVPQPTVSYPIKFPTPNRKPAPPTATVSYPIDLSTLDTGR
ncbi:hypothetical protein ACH4C6_36075 [Streptomyces sp. NPDC017943]|uniref:hypothetical protein n=1 Tax=Streptomyces sp. NPDC017943 TaxID=3365019 RepID=UPI0037958D0E